MIKANKEGLGISYREDGCLAHSILKPGTGLSLKHTLCTKRAQQN